MSEAKFSVGDNVLFYDWPAVILVVEVRKAGFPYYFIQAQDDATCRTWVQENELERYEQPDY